jgi:hypothetical protein
MEGLLAVLLMRWTARHYGWRWAQKAVDHLITSKSELIVAKGWVCQQGFGGLNVLKPAWGIWI